MIRVLFVLILINSLNSCLLSTNKKKVVNSPIIKVPIDKIGYGRSDEYFKIKFVMPLISSENDSIFYAEIPFRFHQKWACTDTIYLQLTKSDSFESDFFEDISCVNCESDSLQFSYEKLERKIIIKGSDFKHTYYLSNLDEWRNGGGFRFLNDPIKEKDISKLTDTSDWVVINLEYMKYGSFKVGDSNYYIGIFDALRDGKFKKQDLRDFVSIQHKPPYFDKDPTARSKSILTAKYIDVFHSYFEIIEIDTNGNFISLKKVNKINQDSAIYLDDHIRDYQFINNNEKYNTFDFLNKGKYLLFDISFNPTVNRNDINKLTELHEKYGDKITILGLYDYEQDYLNEDVKNYNIQYQVGLSTKEINEDLLRSGYPFRVLVSPEGKIIKSFRSINVEEIAQTILTK